jgi:hypothetical protein
MALENGREAHEVKDAKDANGARYDEDKQSKGTEKGTAVNGIPPDPDDGLSAEERALIVSWSLQAVRGRTYAIFKDKKLLRKLDMKLIPWVCTLLAVSWSELMELQLSFLYLISFLDRTNIGNARIYGLQADLGGISDNQYNMGLTVFFISYSLLEPLTNILLKKLRPSVFLPIIMIFVRQPQDQTTPGTCLLTLSLLKWGICMTTVMTSIHAIVVVC